LITLWESGWPAIWRAAAAIQPTRSFNKKCARRFTAAGQPIASEHLRDDFQVKLKVGFDGGAGFLRAFNPRFATPSHDTEQATQETFSMAFGISPTVSA
jgi:hypothetical protein